jgi:N-acetylglucosamine-6-phosphate deacetylase
MILLAGADLVLPDRILERGSLLVDGDRIAAIEPRTIDPPAGATRVDLSGLLVAPGFVDVHVHGLEGVDVLDGSNAVATVAARLPRYGVTAFCPTSIACDPLALEQMLAQVASVSEGASPTSARVLPAHLESNFINPEYNGAQPIECLRLPVPPATREARSPARTTGEPFSAADILDVIAAHQAAVGIVTLAPELEHGLDLVRRLRSAGHRVSIGHSGATYEQALAGIEAGVCHATHLFNRMSPMTHRAPGATGAALQSDAVTAELICDGFHVHPAVLGMAIRTKGPGAVMAITDGTAGSGLAVGARTRLGGRPIVVTERTANLDDGTLAGSVLTMDGAFRTLVQQVGVSLVDAARMCATTPSNQLGLADQGRIVVGALADLVVLDQRLMVHSTYISGRLWRNQSLAPLV